MDGEGEGVAGGVGMVNLGLGWSGVDVAVAADELDKDGPTLRTVGDEGPGSGVDELPVREDSMALSRQQSV